MSSALRTEHQILGMRAEIPTDVVLRGFVTETVVLNLQTRQYHALNPTGGRMVEVLVEAETVRRAAEILATEYGREQGEIAADLCQFCTELEQRGLIALTSSA